MIRQIVHIDMDAFFVSVERLYDPTLAGKPVIVGGNPEGRGVVAAASYEARAYGVRSAMPLSVAKRLCPHAIFLQGDFEKYSRASAKIFSILRHHAPSVEPVSVDEAYIDLTGTRRLLGHPVKAADRMRNEIAEKLGLSASAGIATNKLVAKVASQSAKPAGLLYVMPGREAAFLAPLPIGALPGVGEKTEAHLTRLGIKKIGELARLDEELLRITFGRTGEFLHASAMGLGEEEIEESRGQAKSVSRERTFETDTTDPEVVVPTAFSLTESACAALREDRLVARRLTLKLRYSDFTTITRAEMLSEPTNMDRRIFPTLSGLLVRSWEKRTRIRLIGVSLSGLTPAPASEDLFCGQWERKLGSLYRGIDRIREKYGHASIFIARELLLGQVRA
jgi:DNA polymerase-4